MVETQKSAHDVLGNIYEQKVSHGHNGQFFTPQSVCDLMAQITVNEDAKSISDPACGSGRNLISAAKKVSPDTYFF